MIRFNQLNLSIQNLFKRQNKIKIKFQNLRNAYKIQFKKLIKINKQLEIQSVRSKV